MKKESNFYSPDEVAALIGVTGQIVRVSLKKGRIGWDFPYLMAGRNMKIPKAPFEAWAERMGIKWTQK